MNKDSYYPIEVRIASKNGWSTPQEVPGIWGVPYAREGLTVHWWGDGTGASNHDNIVNFILGRADRGEGSANYVLSDNKITLLVSPDNVAWCSQKGNPTTISVEHQPTLGAEGYKKSGWLLDQLEERYGRRLTLYKHSDWFSTACPGTIDLNRIRQEADKWHTGVYTQPAPQPVPPAPTVQITYSVLPNPITYKINKDTDLWNFNTATWAGFKSVKKLMKGEDFTVYAIADNHSTHSQYGVTKYSFDKKITNGVNMKDLDLPVVNNPQPIPTPPPIQVDPPKPSKDDEQDARLNALEKALKAVVDFLKSIFSGFKG